jgi:hypothetical protein
MTDFVPLSRLAGALRVLFGLEAAVLVLVAVAPETGWLTLALALFVAIAGLFTAWLFQAAENLEALGRRGRFRPGWAIGGWFVPFANAVIPYVMVLDTWRGSAGAVSGRRARRPPPSMPAWWATFVGGVTLLSPAMAPPVGPARLANWRSSPRHARGEERQNEQRPFQ